MPALDVRQQLSNLTEMSDCHLVLNGTFGLFLSLSALELPRNSGVLIPSIVCPAVMSAVQLAGLTPQFMDTDYRTLNSGLEQAQEALLPDTRAIILVHAYGNTSGSENLANYCRTQGLAVIEDACLAYGGHLGCGPVGSLGDISVLSFGYDKPIDIGIGGAVLTSDAELSNRLQDNLTSNSLFEFPKGKVSALSAKLQGLGDAVSIRQENASIYASEICSSIIAHPRLEKASSPWRYSILAENHRDRILTQAKKQNIGMTRHYPSLANFSTFARCPGAQRVSSSVLNLFVREETPRAQIQQSIDFLNSTNYV